MGIRSEVVREDIRRFAPDALCPFDAHYAPPDGAVVLCDMSQMMHTLARSAATDREIMDGTELQKVFRRRILSMLDWPVKGGEPARAATLVCIMDKPGLVPKEKRKTQDVRRDRSTHAPYARGSELGPLGVRELILRGEDQDWTEWAPVDMRRLSISSHMCETSARFMRAAFDGEPEHGERVLIDAFEAGPVWCVPGAAHQAQHRHGLGEADLALFYWTRHFATSRCVVHINVDGDELPVGLALLTKYSPPRALHWIQHWTAARRNLDAHVVDMLAVVDAVKGVARGPDDTPIWPPDTRRRARKEDEPKRKRRLLGDWVMRPTSPEDRVLLTALYCIVFGTDYFRYEGLTRWAGRDVVWHSLNHAWPYLRAALHWAARAPADADALAAVAASIEYFVRQEIFVLFERKLHDEERGPEWPSLPEDLRPPELPLMHPPTLLALHAYALQNGKSLDRLPVLPTDPGPVYASLLFNLRYWHLL